jgi:cell wall-associated NlpC family hydrolase
MVLRRSTICSAGALGVLLIFSLSVARAEQTLDLQLQPVGSSAAPGKAPESRQTVKLPSRGLLQGRANGSSVGRVGYVQTREAVIRKSRSSTASSLFSVSKGTPLAVIDTSGSWYGVLMTDGSTGWVSAADLDISDLRLVADTSQTPGSNSNLLQYAMSFLGTPYVWGGTSRSGSDCSGFVQQVWGAVGVRLPRTAREQALVGAAVAPEGLAPGDRLYFACKGGAVDHTGIYVGNGMFIHSSSSRGGVVLEKLRDSRYINWLVGCRRG